MEGRVQQPASLTQSGLAQQSKGTGLIPPQVERILGEMRRSIRDRGMPPSIVELKIAMGFRSTASVLFWIRWADSRGLIEQPAGPTKGRCWVPAEQPGHCRACGAEVAS